MLKIIKNISFVTSLGLTALFHVQAGANETQYEGIMMANPWVRAMPPGQKVTAAYGRLMNHGDAKVKVIGAGSRWADKVEIHTHIMENGLMKMREVESLELSPHQTIEFKPGGYHLMVFGLNPKAKIGDVVPMVVILENGQKVFFESKLTKEGVASSEHHHHH